VAGARPNHQPIGGSDPNHQGFWGPLGPGVCVFYYCRTYYKAVRVGGKGFIFIFVCFGLVFFSQIGCGKLSAQAF
jgi:hypothetical protein